ncbi:Hsp70 protein-domain-containing protein [Armillaria mellea]|nr:Hsp70 protein-domain-containing protein [Armillaria mellea]
MAPETLANGSADPSVEGTPIPPVVGINFGNSYASIAVFTKEGLAECIANEDGERQIACTIAFHGEETYIGNQAKHQLVKNSKNTITGFRNLLGKKFSEIPSSEISTTSASVIQHPDLPDVPAYKVQVLQAAPAPLPSTASNTPAASVAPTPRSEPTPTERILTVSEVTTIFLQSLIQSAEDFLGKKVQGAVVTVPPTFTDAQIDALDKAASDAGVKVLQFLEEAGAAAATTSSEQWSSSLNPDRTQLIVDLGSSSLSLFVISMREGLAHLLGSSTTSAIGGDQIDDKLVSFFAADFTKKTKTPLKVVPSVDNADKRAEAKLRLAIEHTKRTLSASSGAATCSVESLKEGLDYTGSINRIRFDMVVRSVYTAAAAAVEELLKSLDIDSYYINEVVYVGGTTCLPGLNEHLITSCGFNDAVDTPFSLGTVVGGGVGDPTTILARGSAVQAALIASLPHDEDYAEIRQAFERTSVTEAPMTTRSIGLYFPGEGEAGTWITVLWKDTPLPARRIISFDATLTEESKKFAFEVWEIEEKIRIDKVKLEKVELSDDEEEEEDEYEEHKHAQMDKVAFLGAKEAEALLGIKTKGNGPDAGKWMTTLQVIFQASEEGELEVYMREIGENGALLSLRVPPS